MNSDEEWDNDEESYDNEWNDYELNYDDNYGFKKLEDKKTEKNIIYSKYWECYQCNFINNDYKVVCMSCNCFNYFIITKLFDNYNKLDLCSKCNSYIIENIKEHIKHCNPLEIERKNNNKWYKKLYKSQINSLIFVNKENEKTLYNDKIKLLNFLSDTQLNKLVNLIMYKININVNFKISILTKFLLKDTRLKNVFEVSGIISNNSKRFKVESLLFNKEYDNKKSKERPIYGNLNILFNKHGCMHSKTYGNCFFKLNNNRVRWRTTFCNGDSFGNVNKTSTLMNPYYILNTFSKEEINYLINLEDYSLKDISKKNISIVKQYKELQIHGGVDFLNDIESLYIPKNEYNSLNLNTKNKISIFCSKNFIKLSLG